MKKIFAFAAVALFAVSSVSAQWFVQGSLGYSSEGGKVEIDNNKTDKEVASVFTIAPEVGYKLSDKWAVSLGLAYTFDKYDYKDDVNFVEKTSLFTIAPGVTYICQIAPNFFYTPKLSLGVGFGKYKEESDDPDDAFEVKITNFGVTLDFLAFEFKPAEKWGLLFNVGSLSYTNSTAKPDIDGVDYKDTTNNFNFSIVNNFGVGLRYYF